MRPSGAKRESAEVGFSNALRPKNHLVKALAHKQQIIVIDAEICVFQLGTLEGKRIKWRHKVLLSETDGNVQSAAPGRPLRRARREPMRRMFLMEYMYDNRLRGAAQPKPLSNRVERKNLAVLQKNGAEIIP